MHYYYDLTSLLLHTYCCPSPSKFWRRKKSHLSSIILVCLTKRKKTLPRRVITGLLPPPTTHQWVEQAFLPQGKGRHACPHFLRSMPSLTNLSSFRKLQLQMVEQFWRTLRTPRCVCSCTHLPLPPRRWVCGVCDLPRVVLLGSDQYPPLHTHRRSRIHTRWNDPSMCLYLPHPLPVYIILVMPVCLCIWGGGDRQFSPDTWT